MENYHFYRLLLLFFFYQKSLNIMKYIWIEKFLEKVSLGFIFVLNIYNIAKITFYKDRS